MDAVAVMDATTIAVPLAVVVCRFTAAIDRISRAPILCILPVLYGLMSELVWFLTFYRVRSLIAPISMMSCR